MEPLRVHTSFSARTHTHYAELLANAPREVAFASLPEGWGHPVSDSRAASFAFWKARGAARLLGAPNVERYARALIRDEPVYVHQSILLEPNVWALDLDVVSGLFGYRHGLLQRADMRAWARRRLERPQLRAVTYWSEIAKRGAERWLPSLAPKGLLVRPTVRLDALPAKLAHEGCHVLFVGRAWSMKGGAEAFEAAREVLRRHPTGVRFTFITDLPAGIRPPDDPRIVVLPADIPRERVYAEFFAAADIILFPTMAEIFGLAALEALAFGLPLVAMDTFAIPEIAQDGVEGFVIPGYKARWVDEHGMPCAEGEDWETLRRAHASQERARIVAQLADALDVLVRDPALRARMGKAGRAKVESGPFSATAQQSALRELARRLSA